MPCATGYCATGYCATVLTICLYFKIVCIAIDVEDRDKTALGNTPGTVRSWSILIIIPSADEMINSVDHDQINSSADGMINRVDHDQINSVDHDQVTVLQME